MHEHNFQAPEDLRLGAVSLRVRNLEAMIDFYSDFLGFEVLHHEQDRVELGFDPNQTLVILESFSDGVLRPRQAAGLYHFALLVPDRKRLAQALKRLGQSGYPLHVLRTISSAKRFIWQIQKEMGSRFMPIEHARPGAGMTVNCVSVPFP